MNKTYLRYVAYLFLSLIALIPSYAQITYTRAFDNLSFAFPVEIQNAADGSDRLFVIGQEGFIWSFPNRENVTQNEVQTFLDIEDDVFYNNGEEIGLLGLAFHPDYTDNDYFYVFYTERSNQIGVQVRMVVERYKANPATGTAIPDSVQRIFSFDKNQFNTNHNGGKVAFGPDGYLYISIGDGGGAGDPRGNGQDINNVFGAMLRIDVDLDASNPVSSNGQYEIPSNNPFANSDGLDEIFAWGLRNTWKFSFDNPTGRIWGGDVGQNRFEEVNLITRGGNYGWNRFEANSIEDAGTQDPGNAIGPVLFYDHLSGDFSITGGFVYRGNEITSLSPDIQGKYIYGDYISGRVWALDYNPGTGEASETFLFKTNGQVISSFGKDEQGELYFSDYGSNAGLYKIIDGVTPPAGQTVSGIGSWEELAGGIQGIVRTLASGSNGEIYAAGDFNRAGETSVDNIAVWTQGTGWQALGSEGSNGTINAMAVSASGDVYVGGAFSEIGGVEAENIAVWRDGTWESLGSGLNGPVGAMAIDGDGALFVGGAFEIAGGLTANNVAVWENGWGILTDEQTGIAGTNNEIRSITIDETGIVYFGGNFGAAGGNTANRIASWDGENWGTLGSGTSGFVQAIEVTADYIYAGGNFAIAGNQTVNRIARWDRQAQVWESLGNGLSNNVNALQHDGTYLYVGGTFATASDQENSNIIVNSLARWSENEGWEALGEGTQVGTSLVSNALEFSSDPGRLFVGGNFASAGEIQTTGIAVWSEDNSTSIDTENSKYFAIYPNPVQDYLVLHYENLPYRLLSLDILDLSGRIILQQEYSLTSPSGLVRIENQNWVRGVYFVRLRTEAVLQEYLKILID